MAYGSGYYLANNSNFAGYNGITTGTTVGFTSCANGTLGAYNVTFAGNDGATRYLYTNSGLYTDAGGTANAAGYNFWLEEVTSLPVTISAVGYATLYAPVVLAIPDGVTAYTATFSNGYAHLTELSGYVPANTGVVLAGDAGTYNFTIAEGVEVSGASELTGNIATSEVDASSTAYILANSSTNGVGFYLLNDTDRVITGGKAYYVGTTESSVQAYAFDLTPTGIGSVTTAEDAENAPVYDLSGRRVQKAGKGIYIQNGRKVYVK